MTDARQSSDRETGPDSQPARFAVVGRQNKGKSSVLATLVEEADNDRLRVSAIPGETTRCQVIPLRVNGETLIEFVDTPGFSRARQALAWVKQHHAEGGDAPRIETLQAFVRAFEDGDEFIDECELLRPILAGAGIVYVVDGSKPFRSDFLAEFEILRWTGRPRMAVLNHHSGESDYSEEWRRHLGETFNLTREFNAHHAGFSERVRLLRHLLEIEDQATDRIEHSISWLEAEWRQRRGEAADLILGLLEKVLSCEVCENVGEKKVDRDYKRERVEAAIKERYRITIRDIERSYHRKLVELYRHEPMEINHAGGELLEGVDDLFARETWQVLGLERGQLAWAGAIAGATAGGSIDLATGGVTHGVPTVVGAASGFFAAWWKGRALADIRVRNPLAAGGESAAGGVKLCAGPPRDPNFPWVVLDRILLHYHHLVSRPHGRRDLLVIDFSRLADRGGKGGYVSRLPSADRKGLQQWFTALQKGERPGDEEVFELLRGQLERIEDRPGPWEEASAGSGRSIAPGSGAKEEMDGF